MLSLARASRPLVVSCSTRSISVGTNLSTSPHSWQRSRPWHNSDKEGSNKACDNVVQASALFPPDSTVVVFGVPAPFTGTCTLAHVPGYRALAPSFKAKGVRVVCYSVAGPYEMSNWQSKMSVPDSDMTFLCDVDGSWARSHGLEKDYSAVSLGKRSARFSMIVKDGVVKHFGVVDDAKNDAANIIKML